MNTLITEQETAPINATSLRFTGKESEYFRIWIVNVCLSIITLGLYSPWAKVRRKRYFYGNTLLNDTAFDYLADPKAILKGRLLVLGVLLLITVLGEWSQIINAFSVFIYVLILPYVVIKAMQFNALNSAYRNVRFTFGIGFVPQTNWLTRHFIKGYNQTSSFLVIFIILPLTLGLIYPYYAYLKRRFILNHSGYGTTPFSFDGELRDFYRVYGKVSLVFILFIMGSVITAGIAALPLFSWCAAYHNAEVSRLTWKHTRLGNLRFACDWKTFDLFKLYLVNSLAIIFTLGLMIPWAAIRTARYQLQGISIQPVSEIEKFAAMARESSTATGEEASELLGFDLAL